MIIKLLITLQMEVEQILWIFMDFKRNYQKYGETEPEKESADSFGFLTYPGLPRRWSTPPKT